MTTPHHPEAEQRGECKLCGKVSDLHYHRPAPSPHKEDARGNARLKFLEGVELSYKRLLEILTPFAGPGETCAMVAKRFVENASKSVCVYCGFVADKNSEAMLAHISVCLKHPVGLATRALEATEKERAFLESALTSTEQREKGLRELNASLSRTNAELMANRVNFDEAVTQFREWKESYFKELNETKAALQSQKDRSKKLAEALESGRPQCTCIGRGSTGYATCELHQFLEALSNHNSGERE